MGRATGLSNQDYKRSLDHVPLPIFKMTSMCRVICGAFVVLCVVLDVRGQFPQLQQMQQLQQQLQGFPQQQQHMQPQFRQSAPHQPRPPKRINYMPPCTYLSSRPTARQENTCPFEVETYSGPGKLRIERGRPVQVTVKPWENSPYMYLNFTDFICYAVDTPANPEPGAAPHRPTGVFDLDPRYNAWSAGAKGFKCNRASLGHDAVGSIEEYTLELYRDMFPWDNNLKRYTPRQRLTGMYLWYPTESSMKAQSITFVAKIKIGGEWCKLTSPAWPVYNPPSPEQVFNRQMQQFAKMQTQIRRMEQQARAAEAQAPAKK